MEKHLGGGREGRKKVQLSMGNNAGGGGLEGVVMFGGALAFASLVAAFTLKKWNRNTANVAASDSCRTEEDGAEGLRFILHESYSTLQQNSCCTNNGTSEIGIIQIETCELVSPQSLISSEEKMQCEREDSVSGQREILIHDTEQESIAMTGDVGEISRPVSDDEPMNVVENESDDSLVMETIEIEIKDAAVNAEAEQPAEETPTLQSSLSSVLPKEEEKSSFSTGEEDDEEEEYSLGQSSFSTEEEDREEEECTLMLSLFSKEEEEEDREEQDYPLMQSLFSTEEEEEEEEGEEEEKEEEYSPMRSSFSTEEEDEEEYSPVRPSFSTEEDDEEENSPMESSFSTEDEEEEEEEDDENGEDVTEMEEESGGTWSSSTESNMEAIWPAEMMVLSPESKEINISHGILSVKKFEKDTTAKMEDYLAKTFDESSSNGEDKKQTQELVVMNDQKEHSAKWQTWVWLGLVLLLLILLANCLLQPNYPSNGVSFVFPKK